MVECLRHVSRSVEGVWSEAVEAPFGEGCAPPSPRKKCKLHAEKLFGVYLCHNFLHVS